MNVICCCFHRNKEIFKKAEEDGVGVLNFEEALKVRAGHGGAGHVGERGRTTTLPQCVVCTTVVSSLYCM